VGLRPGGGAQEFSRDPIAGNKGLAGAGQVVVNVARSRMEGVISIGQGQKGDGIEEYRGLGHHYFPIVVPP